ncbi:MAG TPA: NHL repeat-containing protein [Armatimonadota bacterium]|nr:NHL repeat-containing protein [Armatimonadota bacterium]
MWIHDSIGTVTRRRGAVGAVLALLCCGLPGAVLSPTACAAAEPAAAVESQRLQIAPSFMRLELGATREFAVRIAGGGVAGGKAPAVVSWSVNDVRGGGSEFGTITPDGVYTAPKRVPAFNEVCITAAIDDGGRKRELWATVLIGPFNPEYTAVATWPARPGGPGEFSPPHGICFDADGNLVVSDSDKARVYRLSPQGKYLDELDPSPEKYEGPRDATVDADGNILVVDGNKGRVFVFDRSGKFITAWGEKGSAPGELSRPHGIAIGKHGRIYIVDVDNGRVQVYDPAGHFLFQWGARGAGPGEFKAAHGIAVDPNGNIFVCEWVGGRCQKFTPEGVHLQTFAVLPRDGERAYHAMTCDRYGNVYLATKGVIRNRWPSTLDKYNNEGDYITVIALPPTPERRHYRPSTAAVGKDGRVYVTNGAGGKVGVDVFAPGPPAVKEKTDRGG